MKDGKITQCVKYNDMLNSGTDFMELVSADKNALSALDSLDGGEVPEKLSSSEQDLHVYGAQHVEEKEENKEVKNDTQDDIVGVKGQLVQEEERDKGKVGFAIYWKYITTAYGGALAPFILLAQILFQLLQIGSNYWMAWATPVSAEVKTVIGPYVLIVVYVDFAIGSSCCILARAMLLVTAGLETATVLFNKLHFCIFRAPMSFFDATPSGRILNRVCSTVDIMYFLPL